MARLKAEALADDTDPGRWGIYARYVQALHLAARREKTPVFASKPPLLDPLTLGQSHLAPENLWNGAPPVWEDHPVREDPEE